MYQEKSRKYGIIGMIYWGIYMLGLLGSGILYSHELPFQVPYITLIVLAIGIAFVMDKKKMLCSLGFSKEHIKADSIIAVSACAITYIFSVFVSEYSPWTLLKTSLYYLLYIGAVEEIAFRGLIQNYLFGWKCNRTVLFLIGAAFFSLSHLPFQMFANGNVSLSYLTIAWPNLIYTFFFHLLLCFIANKRKNILIPIALHYISNYIDSTILTVLFCICYTALVIGHLISFISSRKNQRKKRQTITETLGK